MPRSRAGTTVLWVVFAVFAIVSGWIAVQMVGNAVTPASIPVLTSSEVASRLSTASPAATQRPDKPKPTQKPRDKATSKPSSKPSAQPTTSSPPKPTPKPTPTKTSAPSPDTVVRSVASRGGSVVAACTSGRVKLRSWSPAVGYRVDEVDRGPATEVEVKFVSTSAEVQLKVRCVSGVPTGQSEVDDESGDDD